MNTHPEGHPDADDGHVCGPECTGTSTIHVQAMVGVDPTQEPAIQMRIAGIRGDGELDYMMIILPLEEASIIGLELLGEVSRAEALSDIREAVGEVVFMAMYAALNNHAAALRAAQEVSDESTAD